MRNNEKRGAANLSAAGSAAGHPCISGYSTAAFIDRIEALECEYAGREKPKDLILVTGDSDVVLWQTLEKDLLPWTAWNCGFGGATTIQTAYYADRLILPNRPVRVILNAGDNDLGYGTTPAEVVQDTDWFVSKVHGAFPDALIYIMSIKRTEMRDALWSAIQETNRRLADYASKQKNVRFVDATTPMINADQSVRTELYRPDRLHLNEAGYRVFAEIVRQALARE